MKKANVTRFVVAALVALLLLMPLMGACSKPAPAPVPAPAPKTNPMAQIIEGAKKEGAVSASMAPNYDDPKSVELLKKGIKDKYGVDLDIRVQGVGSQAALTATAIMETKTGAVPTYDLIGFNTDYIPRGTKEGIFEMVDWRSILEPGTSPKVQYDHPQIKAGVVLYGTANGLVYNPEKISAAEAPKKLADLADPKWKGRLGMYDYASHWARYAFMLGKDRTLATLRSILTTNKPILDGFPPLNTRYLTGEIDLAFTTGSYIEDNRARGKPTAWRALDFVEIRDAQLVVMKGTKRPNAAKLVSIFLASPEGAKFSMDVVRMSHPMYAGNQLYAAVEAANKEAIPVYTWESFPGLLDFIASPAFEALQKEIQLILDTNR